MSYLFIIACIVLFIIEPCNPAFGVSNSQILCMFSYHFMHVNWLHLIVNMISMILMYRPIHHLYIRRFGHFMSPQFFISMYTIATIAGAFTANDVPTYGASGIIFALLGSLLMLNPTLKQLKNFIYVALAVLISLFTDNSNVALHLLSFVFGALFIIILTAYDNRRTAKNR